MTKPIPEGYHTLTPYLAVDDASAAIDFYTGHRPGALETGREQRGDPAPLPFWPDGSSRP
jgi:hypothetical protein